MSDEGTQPHRVRKPWPTIPAGPYEPLFFVLTDRIDEIHSDIDELKARPPTTASQLIGLARLALGEKGKNAPILGICLLVALALVYGIGNLVIEGYGVTVTTSARAATVAPADP